MKFAKTYEILQQGVVKLSWRSNLMLIDKIKDENKRNWYIEKALENNWSSTVLDHQIATALYERQGDNENKVANYNEKLDDPYNERVLDTLKDPYLFNQLVYKEGILEHEIEKNLVSNVTKLLLELGDGFAFYGRQYHINIGEEDFYIDLLFYNTKLNCYVVIELKTDKFKPEYAGQLSFYVNAVDKVLKGERDNPTIGILFCRSKDDDVTRVSLEVVDSPIGVAEYKFSQEIPEYLKNIIPSKETIETRLNLLEAENDE